ncbi:Unknown protein sequence [Pseudomonas cannabina pv. alisalensis]|nr:Unknown protein sequence [Pseudomonas cannabina pv. alisalensis]RMN83162.1 hypothetical protein ALQ52_04355 [Pseudomonas cannabina pv. alisalensis]
MSLQRSALYASLEMTIVRRSASTCRSGRSASGLECAVRRRFVTQSVTQGIPTLERAER